MTTNETPDLLYGYEEIGAFLGLGVKQVQHLAEKDGSDIPIFSIGRRRCALRSKLTAWLADKAAQANVEGRSGGHE